MHCKAVKMWHLLCEKKNIGKGKNYVECLVHILFYSWTKLQSLIGPLSLLKLNNLPGKISACVGTELPPKSTMESGREGGVQAT